MAMLMRRLFRYAVFAGFQGFAAAADINTDLRIDAVTVYTGSAMVTRTGQVALPAGNQRIIVRGLPADIEPNALRLGIDSRNVELAGVEVETINDVQLASEAERALRAQIEAKTDQRAVVQDEIATAETQLKLLESLAANPGGNAGSGAAVNGTTLPAVLSTIGTAAASARGKVRDARQRLRAIDREIEKLNADIAKVATQRKRTTEVRALVNVKEAVTTGVHLTYPVADAGWGSVYQARLDTAAKRLVIQRDAEVHQGSGEDWNAARLTLTTAQTSADAATPTIAALFLDLRVPQPPQVFMAKARGGVAADAMAPAPPAAAAQEIVVTGARRTETQYLVEYQLPARVTLKSDREPRLFPVATDQFDVGLIARVLPAQRRSAFLEATFKFEQDAPLEAGTLKLYRDGAYVGEAASTAFLPGSDVRVPFGIDERIKVAVRDESAKSAERGVVSKQITRETRQRFEVTNYHAATIPVEIIDRVPVSRNADVKVEVLKGATEPTQRDLDGKAGVLLWRLDVAPQKTELVRQYYSVKYPRDRVLESSEESGSE
jgi:uncharacterized protein (TIGR02231 family)